MSRNDDPAFAALPEATIADAAPVSGQVKGGRVRALAVTSPDRADDLSPRSPGAAAVTSLLAGATLVGDRYTAAAVRVTGGSKMSQ